MLRLYYGNAGENKYVSVGYFPMSTYIRHEIANQTTDSNHGWTSGASLVEVTAKPGSDAKEFLTTYGDHPLYIDIEHTKQIDGIILKTEYFTSHQATMMLIWNGRTLYNFRFWDNWGTTSLMSPFSSPDDLASNDEEWKYFINKMFEIESEQVNWTKAPLSYTYGNGLCDTPLLAPFIPAEISFSAGILSGWYYNANFRFPGINILSAATWATAYLGYPAIQVSTMYDKSGNEFYPCVAYNPLHWNADAFTAAKKASDGRVHAYGFESGDDAKSDTKGEIRYQSNNDIPVINNAVNSDLTISFQDKTIVQTAQFKLLYVQAGTQFITYGQATSKLDVVRTGEWVGLKYSMINRANDEDSYGYVGMVSVIQLTDSNSLKNMAIKYKDSTDFFKIHSTQYADTPYIGIFQLFHSRNNGWEDDYNMMFLWATQLSGEASNNISGQEILDTFYKSSEEPDDPIIVTEDASNTIPPDKDGAGGTSGDKHTGGDGTWDNSSQDTSVNADGEIDEDKIAPAPTGMYGGVDNGVTTVKLNSAQFNTLCDLLWDESFLSNVSQIFGLDAIKNAVGNIKYGNIEIPSAGETKIKKIAGYTLQSAAGGTGPIGCNKINQYNRYSFGKLSVPKYFGSFLDYAPYTQINLVLPFASSSINIPPELAVGKEIEVVLTVDVTTGAGTYVIQNSDGVQISTFMVNVLAEMPFATSSFGEYATDVITNTVRATADTFKSIQPMVRTETASLSGLSKAFSPGGSIDMSHTSTAGVSGAVAGASVVSMVAATTAEAAHAANSRTETWNAGSASQIGSNAKAIMKISRPYIVYPERYTEFFGLPSNQIGKIGDCTGYFEVEKFVPSFSAPADELAEIAQILAAGVIP